jgi:hypothetical protein
VESSYVMAMVDVEVRSRDGGLSYLDAPQVVFLFAVVLGAGAQLRRGRVRVTTEGLLTWLLQWFTSCVPGCSRGSEGSGLGVVRGCGYTAVFDQIEQVRVLHSFDLVGEKHEPAIKIIELAPIEFVPELLIALREGVPP